MKSCLFAPMLLFATLIFSHVTAKSIRGNRSLQDNASIVLEEHPNSAQSPAQINRSRTVQIVRLLATDSEPTLTANDLWGYVFTNEQSLKHQMAACSGGKVQLEPTDAGIIDVPINMKATGTQHETVTLAAEREAVNYLPDGIYNIRQAADHVMLVVPPGTAGDLSAYSEVINGLTTVVSVYEDAFASSLSFLLHETGHNLGLPHAGTVNEEYGDMTGAMGASLSMKGGPAFCYNAANHWQLGWYDQNRLDLTTVQDTPQTVTIAAFVDHAATNQPVLVKAGDDLFMQYNRAKSYNAGTLSAADQLVLVRQFGSSTIAVATLGRGQVYTDDRTVTVEVCDASASSTGVDTLTVSIGKDSTDCSAYRKPCDLCLDGNYPTSSNQQVLINGLAGTPTCGDLVEKGRQGLLSADQCSTVRKNLQQICGCNASQAANNQAPGQLDAIQISDVVAAPPDDSNNNVKEEVEVVKEEDNNDNNNSIILIKLGREADYGSSNLRIPST